MRIVFVGAVDFSRHCLERVVAHGGDVVAAFSPPREHARSNADWVDLGEVARRHGIEHHPIRRLNDAENVDRLRALAPDVVFVFGLSQLVHAEILSIPRLGCVGSHPTLLPEGRGRHPLIWTLVKGLQRGGLTFFWLSEGADTGDILWQRAFPVALDDDAGTLYQRIKALAGDAIAELLPQLQAGIAPRLPQDDSRASVWRKRSPADGRINWEEPSLTTYNLVRALTHPYPGATARLAGVEVVIWRSRLGDGSAAMPLESTPGRVLGRRDRWLCVATGDGVLEVELETRQLAELGEQLGGFDVPREDS